MLYFVRTDHIGRPVFATNTAGAVVWSASYLPFGGVRVSTGVPIDLRFPGQWFQAESGLHQNWMRDYDPPTGRYLQADPLGLIDGASVYGYARQSPLMWTDPRGEQSLTDDISVWMPPRTSPVSTGIAAGIARGVGLTITLMVTPSPAGIGSDYWEGICSTTCPPCQPYAEGTIGYRGPDYGRPRYPTIGPHFHLFIVRQEKRWPICTCRWNAVRENNGVAPYPPDPDPTWVNLNAGFPALRP